MDEKDLPPTVVALHADLFRGGYLGGRKIFVPLMQGGREAGKGHLGLVSLFRRYDLRFNLSLIDLTL